MFYQIKLINPFNNKLLKINKNNLVDSEGNIFPIVNGIPRFLKSGNYTDNFGFQWNKFRTTQLDNDLYKISENRFFKQTNWNPSNLNGKFVLEVGSGAGRFSRIILSKTNAILYSIDYSESVDANFQNNNFIAPNRLKLFQCSIYEMPFEDCSFDKVFCFGVLQHTPNFEESIKSIVSKAKKGGEIVVDFYPINGWWTKLHSKYLFRSFLKKMNNEKLLFIIERYIDPMILIFRLLEKLKLGLLTRFLPIVDLRTIDSTGLTTSQFKEWVILDTFDMFSPEYDNPQKINEVVRMFERNGVKVSFAGYVNYHKEFKSAVVKGYRI